MERERASVRRDRTLERSVELAERAEELIPGGSQTGSKALRHWVSGASPTHIERGDGARVWDVDGNEYVDYTMALGPVSLGYGYPAVDEAVRAQVERGATFSMPHRLQVEVADRLVDMVPCAGMVQFAKNGNDVTTLAAKLARAYTGNEIVATQGYHGWSDTWLCDSSFDRGVPAALDGTTRSFKYNDISSLDRIFDDHPDDVAAVVTTPVNLEPPKDDFLERVRERADEHDALLVFDEILTGFRFAEGGAQEFFDVEPDLTCFAKAIANGYPLSALAGRRDVMEVLECEDVFFSLTYAGEAVSLAAAKATLDVVNAEEVVERIASVGSEVRDGYNELAAEFGLADRTECVGYPQRFSTVFSDEDGESDPLAKSLFMQECMKRGVLFAGNNLPCYSHTDDDVAETLTVYREAMAELKDALSAGDVEARLTGSPVGQTLRQRTGEN